MANKIKEEDIFDGNVFEKNAQSAKELAQYYSELLKLSQKKISFLDPKTSQDIQEANDLIVKTRIERQLLTEQNKLATEQQKQATIEAKKANAEAKKELDAYQQKSKALNDLRKKYKAVAVEQGLNAKATKELAKEVQKLDEELKEIDASAGQFQRNVGNYPQVTEKAKGAFSSLSGFLLGVVVGAFTKSRAEADKFNALLERLTNQVTLFGRFLLQTFTQVILPTLEVWALRLKAVGEATSLNFENAKKLNAQADELAKTIKNLSDVWQGYTDIASESDDLVDARLEKQRRLVDQAILLEKSIAELSGQEEKTAVLVGDATSSFNAQGVAIEKLTKLTRQRIGTEIELAKKQQDIAFDKVKNDLLQNQAFKNLTDLQKKDLEQKIRSLEFLKQKELADAVGIENLNELKGATLGLIDAQNRQKVFDETIAKEERQRKQDIFEQDLDILLDGFDNQKTINERLIADENKKFEERKLILNRTKQLNEQNLKDQQALFIEQTGLQIDLNDLVATDDQKLLQQKLDNLGELTEIERQRLLEVIRDQRTANQDLIDAENDLFLAIKEKDERILESKLAIKKIETEILTEENNRQFELEEQRQEANVIFRAKKLKEIEKINRDLAVNQLIEDRKQEERLANQIVEEDEKNQKLKEIEAKFQQDLLAIDNEFADKRKELDRKEFLSKVEEAERLYGLITDIYKSELDKQSEAQAKAFDKREEELEKSLDTQRELANNGQKNILADVEARRVEAELQRQQAEEREQKRKDAIATGDAFLQAYINNLKQPNTTSEQALLKATKQTGEAIALKSIIGGLFSAKDGAEDTGAGGNIDKDKGFLAVLHPHERVLTKEQNEPLLKMGISNDILPNLVMDGLKFNSMPNIMQSIEMNRTSKLETKLDKLIETVANKPYYIDTTDKHGNHVRTTVEGAMKRTVKYVKQRPRI